MYLNQHTLNFENFANATEEGVYMQSMSLANSSIQEEESKSKFILATNQR